MVKAILWDIDGTLLNFAAPERAGIRGCFAHFGLGECTDEMIARYSAINVGWWESLERGEHSRPEIMVGRFRDFLGECGLDASLAAAFNAEYERRLPETIVFEPGAWETVLALRGRVRQYAVTNGAKEVQDRKLHASKLDTVLDGVFISQELGADKPSGAYFAKVFAAIGEIRPEEMLLVGDSLTSDIRGGNNAGIPTVWYNPAGKPVPTEPRIDHVIRAVPEVLSLLDQR